MERRVYRYNPALLVPRSAPKQAPARPRRRIRKLRLLGLLLILFVLGSMSFTFGLVTSVASEIPSLDPARLQQREVDGYIYDRKGQRVLAVLRGKQSRILVPLEQDLATGMKQAIVAIEDKRFYEHRGVDIHGILRAVLQDVRHQQVVEGGSTITQQFVKNTYTQEPALDRPQAEGGGARVAARAALVEGPDPDRLPEHDLLRERRLRRAAGGADLLPPRRRQARLGRGGAARRDPERPVASTTRSTNPQAARERRNVVLKAMLDQGDITQRRVRERQQAPSCRARRTSTSRASAARRRTSRTTSSSS